MGLLQSSDIRKTVAYRGYLRTTSGNHNVIGLNATASEGVQNNPRLIRHLLKTLRNKLGPSVYNKLPYIKSQRLWEIRPASHFATAFHFKWVQGLTEKLFRRVQTEPYTVSQYGHIREVLLNSGHFVSKGIERFCNVRELPGPLEPIRALSSLEFMLLFLNIKAEHVEDILNRQKVPKSVREPYLADMLQNYMSSGIVRETGDGLFS